MDSAVTLIKGVVRTFYQTQHVLVVDALMVHSALSVEDLAFVVSMQNKELRDLCGTLRADRMLAVHSRPEVREGQQRPINKDYYYIDFHATIDAIKYRVLHLEQKIKEMYDPNEEKKDYFCPRCKARYTEMEVLPYSSGTGFDCSRCGNSLEVEERNDGASAGTEMSTRFASQMEPFVDLLKKIDNEVILANDFETAFSKRVPVERSEDTSSRATTVPLEAPKDLPATVRGMTQVAAGPLDVIVTSSAERTAAEKVAEAKRKEAIAAQNQLPEWHAKSTVTGESVALRKDSEQLANGNGGPLPNGGEEVGSGRNNLDEELAAYYAQMAQEAEAEREKEGESDSDEAENDFEDVDLKPSVVSPSESGSSASVTNTNALAVSGSALAEEEGPTAKKVKFDSQKS